MKRDWYIIQTAIYISPDKSVYTNNLWRAVIPSWKKMALFDRCNISSLSPLCVCVCVCACIVWFLMCIRRHLCKYENLFLCAPVFGLINPPRNKLCVKKCFFFSSALITPAIGFLLLSFRVRFPSFRWGLGAHFRFFFLISPNPHPAQVWDQGRPLRRWANQISRRLSPWHHRRWTHLSFHNYKK